jgi:transposase-like protein
MLSRAMAERHNRAFWAKAAAQVDRGASCVEVATHLGVNVSTLRWWRSELRRSLPARVRVLPVEVEPTPVSAARLELRLASGDALAFEAGVAPAYIAAVVSALRSPC